MNTLHVDVVSAEESIFSGEARFVALPGEAGELGIYPRHTPLITRIKAGSVRIQDVDGQETFIFAADRSSDSDWMRISCHSHRPITAAGHCQ